jgi:uncharacterized protein YndB with AHSA1/START domain
MKKQPIVLEQVVNAPIAIVWKAITDKDEMKNWYFDLAEFKTEIGFSFEFTGGPSPDRQYLHHCEITEVIPGKKVTYSWRYIGYEGISYVTFELMPLETKTLVQLMHTDIDSFPDSNPDFAIHNFEEGWDYILHTALKNYVESKE